MSTFLCLFNRHLPFKCRKCRAKSTTRKTRKYHLLSRKSHTSPRKYKKGCKNTPSTTKTMKNKQRYNVIYSFFASKLGHALLTFGKSLCPCIFAPGNFAFNSFSTFNNDAFCAAVRVSFGLPVASMPPI